jgi:hypothetical protein
MNRRNAMKAAAGIIAGGGAGLLAMTYGFKVQEPSAKEPLKVDYTHSDGGWSYAPLEPQITAQMAYNLYSEGSCMYATMKSVVSQLAQVYGEPYTSFPHHMFKYGHGGVGGYGSVCGALNGAAALIGLLVADKNVQDLMITDLFKWYEKEPFPAFKPEKPVLDFVPAASISNSVLCHVSNTSWCNATGFQVASNERKERCRRLTSDVVKKVTASLNDVMTNVYVAGTHADQESATCLACHGNEGKVKNTSVSMSCNSCHSESIGHKVFSDIHYRMME